MKRIKALNGYTIFQITERDAKQNPAKNVGDYEIYFSSDIRDYGVKYSYAEFDGVDGLQNAIELCGGNYAIAREIAETISTCVTFEEIETIENALNTGVNRETIENAIENDVEIETLLNDENAKQETPAGVVKAYIVNGYIDNETSGKYEPIDLKSYSIFDGGYFKILVTVGNSTNDYIIDARYNNCLNCGADKLHFIKSYLHSIYTGKNGAYLLHVTETKYIY